MDPKENDTQTPPTDDQAQQPTAQQKADGELVVSHEAEVDTTIPGADSTGADPTLPTTDPTAVTGGVTNPDGSDSMGTDVGNGMPSDSFAPPEAPGAPMADQPVAPTDGSLPDQPPVQPMPQPDQAQPLQPFPPASPTPTDPSAGVPPVAPTDPAAPVAPPAQSDAGTPMGGIADERKNRMMMLLLILIGAVVVLGLGIYAVMQL